MKMEGLYEIYQQYPSIQTDTRKLKPGDIFFALKGGTFNGNEFAEQAIRSGAAYAVIDEKKYAIAGKTILVDDALETLQQLAKFHREQFSIPFIAITGSNGKTTTKELVHAVLSSQYRTYTTEGNLNNHIGVPLTILKTGKDADMAVIEMGANHLNEIASYCRIALPTHGLITNCGKAHLEGFGSEEGVRKGKGELFDFLRENGGTAFVMWDYSYLREMSTGIANVVTYGTGNAQVAGAVIKSDPFLEVGFTAGFEGKIETGLVGGYNLPNVLAAVAIGIHFSVTDSNIRAAIEKYQPSNSRSQLVRKGTNTLILDAYNANPSSMKAAIENFARVDGEKILVLGAMAELGPDSKKEHQDLVEEIKRHRWREVIFVGDEFSKTGHAHHQFTDAVSAGKWLQNQHISNSYFLIKGSRSMAMEKVVDYL